jgi:hypothetical protein
MAPDSQNNEQPWLTVSEAARRLGVSRQAISHRIKRGTLRTQPSNHGLLVQIPPDAPVAVTVDNEVAEALPQVLLEALRERVAGLEQRLADRDAEIGRRDEEIARLQVQLSAQADKHCAERAELLAGAAAERERLLMLLERAMVRRGLLERLLSVVRPSRS